MEDPNEGINDEDILFDGGDSSEGEESDGSMDSDDFEFAPDE